MSRPRILMHRHCCWKWTSTQWAQETLQKVRDMKHERPQRNDKMAAWILQQNQLRMSHDINSIVNWYVDWCYGNCRSFKCLAGSRKSYHDHDWRSQSFLRIEFRNRLLENRCGDRRVILSESVILTSLNVLVFIVRNWQCLFVDWPMIEIPCLHQLSPSNFIRFGNLALQFCKFMCKTL